MSWEEDIKMDFGGRLWECEVRGTGLGPCPTVDFALSGVDLSYSATTLVTSFVLIF